MDVVICDDAGFVRAILAEACVSLGHVVIQEASTTQNLVEILQSKKPHCLFLDIVLPEQDGLSFFRDDFRGSDTRVIFMSSLGANYFREKLEKLLDETDYPNEIYFLNKPFELKDLKEIFTQIENEKKAG